MAGADRFYRPGQSGYVSQYMPIKLPFELMQQKLARTEQGVEAAKAASVFDVKAEGITKLDLPESVRSYYEGSGFDIEEKFNDIFVDDLRESTIAANEFNKKLNKATGDKNFILNVTSGDYANTLIDLQKEYKGLQAINSRNLARKEWTEKANQELAKHAEDISMSPYLLTDYSLELANMAKDKNYVPTSMPMIGKSMDRVNEFLSQVDRLKDEGRSGTTIKHGELYNKWSSWKGRGADDYAAFGKTILDNKGSKIRQDIERQVDAHIRRGLLHEENKEAAIQYEIDKLIKSARELEHKVVESDWKSKDKYTIEQERLQEDGYVKNDAYNKIQDKQVLSVAELETGKKAAENVYNKLENQMSSIIEAANKNGGDFSFKDFADYEYNDIIDLAEKSGVDFNTLWNNKRIVADSKKKYDAIQENYLRADMAARGGAPNWGIEGFSQDNEKELQFLKNLGNNTNKALEIYQGIGGRLANPDIIAKLNPQEKFMYNQMVAYSQKVGGDQKLIGMLQDQEGFKLATTNERDFYNSRNEFDSVKALQYLENLGIDPEEYGGNIISVPQVYTDSGTKWLMKQPGDTEGYTSTVQGIDEASFKMILNSQSNSEVRKNFKDLTDREFVYKINKSTPYETRPKMMRTYPGYAYNEDAQTLNYMAEFINPLATEVVDAGGNVLDIPNSTAYIQNLLRSQKDGMMVTKVGVDEYVFDAIVSPLEAVGGNIRSQDLMDEWLDSQNEKKGSKEYDDLDKDELKIFADWAQTQNKNISTKIKVDQSSQFTESQSKKIANRNRDLSAQGKLTTEDIFAESSQLNKNTHDKLEGLDIKLITAQSIGKRVTPRHWGAGMASDFETISGDFFNQDEKSADPRGGKYENLVADIKYDSGSLDETLRIPIYNNGVRSVQNFNVTGISVVPLGSTGSRNDVFTYKDDGTGDLVFENKDRITARTQPITTGGLDLKRFVVEKDGAVHVFHAYDSYELSEKISDYYSNK